MSGGRVQPVSSGETSLAIIPDGAIRKAKPKAAAACGTLSSGETRCCSRPKVSVPDQPARKSATTMTETSAETRPAWRLIRIEEPMAGCAAKAR